MPSHSVNSAWIAWKLLWLCTMLSPILSQNKRPRGLDTLLTKLLHQHNFHNLRRDLPRMPHTKFEVNQPRIFRFFFNWAEKMKKQLQKRKKMLNQNSFQNFNRDPPHEVNQSTNFRRDNIWKLAWKKWEAIRRECHLPLCMYSSDVTGHPY